MTRSRPSIVRTPPGSVPLRGPSGRLYGMLNPETLIIEVKRGERVEHIPIGPYLAAAAKRK